MLEIEKGRHQPSRCFVYALAGAAAVALIAAWALDASGMAMNGTSTTQRATAVW